MEIAIYGLGVLAGIGFVVFSIAYSSHRTHSLWFLFFPCLILSSLAVTLLWQRLIWDEQQSPDLEEPTFREKTEVVKFSLGGGGITVGYRPSDLETQPREPFDFAGFKPVRLYVKDGKLRADVTVFGGPGEPSIEVRGNEFVVRPTGWDRNSNKTALEIVNQSRVPVFQLIHKSSSHIVVNGIFPYPGGLILANEDRTILNPTLPTAFRLKRIFKYPAWQYPGYYDQD